MIVIDVQNSEITIEIQEVREDLNRVCNKE